jgi:cyclic pyranopterin phosphate synthase
VRGLKITGGEPTIRADLPTLAGMFRSVGPDLDISITTNGLLLDRLAAPLAEAGVDRATVSCDSLLQHRFAEMTRRDTLDKVLAGIRAAEAAGLTPIKINTVVIGGTNDDEVADFARWARETGYEVRFIEYMPLDADRGWSAERVLTGAEARAAIHAVYPLEPEPRDPHATARVYRFTDGRGRIGFVNPVSEPFCGDCNRIRLTADGHLRTCLFSLNETDLRTPLRDGASDDDLEQVIRAAVWAKELKHHVNEKGFVQPQRTMSAIGG